MVKIYTSPSSQPKNVYVVGNTNEQEQCRKIGVALDAVLERCGFDSKVGLSGTMYTRTAESNSYGAKLHLPIHTNGFDGKVAGLRIFVYKLGGEAEKIAKAIMKTLAPITPGTSDGISVQTGLYEIYATNATCVYIEVGFHDNPEEAQWIIDHTEDIAEAIAKGLCNHYGVAYVEDGTTPDEPAKENYTLEQFIREVQAATGATVDGIAGPETIGKTVTLSRTENDFHAAVLPVQKRLLELGYIEVGEADGEAGRKFASAVAHFQQDNGCVVDGEITATMKTWRKLLGME